jgi:predicted phage baseplate assembly protein
MTLKAPNLDDRKFQDIVSEARSKIPQYCPEWTDYNLSDPGVTLIELFAWMVDMTLFRLNRVPEKNYIKFMELIGIHLEAPKPAQIDITFRLSAPQPHPIKIPKGTEVATMRTETQEAISFTTNQDLVVVIPQLAYALTTPDSQIFTDCMSSLKKQDKRVMVFKSVPEENNAIYFGFAEALGAQTILLTIDSSIEGIGVDPNEPPLVWEFWDAQRERWESLRIESDTTGGLNTRGTVILYAPNMISMTDVNGQRAFWIRCRATKPRDGQRPYTNSPQIKSIVADCIGGTVSASHCLRMAGELLGRSTGNPGQKFTLHNTPVLPRQVEETLEVETEREGEFETWQEVPDFSGSGPADSHFTLDSTTGEVQFGPLVRQPTGQELQYGKVPALGRRLRFTGYRWGGGIIGNIGRNTIRTLKSSMPYIASVTNLTAAAGGTDAETLEAAMLRAPKLLRNQTRAVTADDFEYLAVQASPAIARAKCLASGQGSDSQAIPPGVVRLLLVPRVDDVEGPIPKDQLELLGSVRSVVQEYIDERRLLAMRVEIAPPEYQPIAVDAQVRVKPGIDFDQVIGNVKRKLYQYINPVWGGPKGQGWPFGRGLFPSEIYSVIQSVPDVDYVESAHLFTVDWETGQRQPVTDKITIPPNGLLCSSEHHVSAMLVESD